MSKHNKPDFSNAINAKTDDAMQKLITEFRKDIIQDFMQNYVMPKGKEAYPDPLGFGIFKKTVENAEWNYWADCHG